MQFQLKSRTLALLLAGGAVCASPAVYARGASANPMPVLIDTDMAPDDWSAILYLLNRPDVRVVGIAVTGTGEAHCDLAKGDLTGARNALGLIELAGKSSQRIPVACGSPNPLRGTHVFPQPWRVNSDTVFGISLPTAPYQPLLTDAVDMIRTVLRASPQPVRILTLGPLTNLATALEQEPSLTQFIDSIVVMGGAVNVPGNMKDPGSPISNNDVSEWNIYIDPYAAEVVFSSGVPIQLVSLDGTNYAQVTMDFWNRLGQASATASSRFVHEYLGKETDFINTGLFFFWDPLAAAVVTNPELCRFQTQSVTVVDQEGPEIGRTRVDAAGHYVQVCNWANGPAFENLFIETL